jgi:hypothetical protein
MCQVLERDGNYWSFVGVPVDMEFAQIFAKEGVRPGRGRRIILMGTSHFGPRRLCLYGVNHTPDRYAYILETVFKVPEQDEEIDCECSLCNGDYDEDEDDSEDGEDDE